MIPINETRYKYVYFLDKNGAFRISKIVNIRGNTITTQTATGERERIHPKTHKIFGIVVKSSNHIFQFDEIQFKQERTGKKLRNKEKMREIKNSIIKKL